MTGGFRQRNLSRSDGCGGGGRGGGSGSWVGGEGGGNGGGVLSHGREVSDTDAGILRGRNGNWMRHVLRCEKNEERKNRKRFRIFH